MRMGTLTFDFAFIENSLLHGEFLTEVHRSCVDAKIEKVSQHHAYKAGTVFLSVSVPEDIATVLKLRFGQCIVVRQVKEEKEDEYNIRKLKDRYSIKKYLKEYDLDLNWKKDLVFYDYIDIIKDKKEVEKENAMMKQAYLDELMKVEKTFIIKNKWSETDF
jgi:hypothetical protein